MPIGAVASHRVPAGPDVLAEIFDGEAVVVHLTTGVYYAFDRKATQLWEALSGADSGDLSGERLAFLAFLAGEQLASAPGFELAGVTGWPGVSRFTDMADLLVLDPIHDIDLDGSGWPIVEDGPRAAAP